MTAPLITLITDYGLRDAFVGVCHAVIAGICPQARVIDLSHGIPRHDVTAAADTLAGALPYTPVGVHVVVVDPGVGGTRRAVAVAAADGRVLVGPDNGVLWPALVAAGGAVEAVEISHSRWRLEPVSATFHGRDIFAPVAARIAAGEPVAAAGDPVDPAELVALELPRARYADGHLHAPVLSVDTFGNVQLAIVHTDLEAIGLQLGHQVELTTGPGATAYARFVRTFSEARAGELIVLEDAGRRLAIALDHDSAADRLALGRGDAVSVARVEA